MRERLLREKSQQLAAQRQQQQPPQQPQQAPQQPQQPPLQQQQAQPQQQGVSLAVPPYQPGVDPQPAAPPLQAPEQVQHGQLPPAAAVVPAVPGFKSVSGRDHLWPQWTMHRTSRSLAVDGPRCSAICIMLLPSSGDPCASQVLGQPLSEDIDVLGGIEIKPESAILPLPLAPLNPEQVPAETM
jgi:hypothetical protein